MTPVYKLSANSVKNGRTVYGSMLAGNPAFNPLHFESIATVTVGSGGSASVEFTSIPGTYRHLQIRGITRAAIAEASTQGQLYVNGDTANNYATHSLYGTGTGVGSEGAGDYPRYYGFDRTSAGNTTANVFGAFVMDILDYSNTNKFKTFRTFAGFDANGSGQIRISSGLWRSTSAITSINLSVQSGGNYAQYSHFALYGIR